MPVIPTADPGAVAVADPWIAGAMLLFILAMLILSLVGRGEVRIAPAEERLDQLDKRLTTHDARLALVEERQVKAENGQAEIRKDIARLPSKEVFDGLSAQVGEMRVEVRGVADMTAKAAHSVTRMEDFLMVAAADVIAGKSGDQVKTSTATTGTSGMPKKRAARPRVIPSAEQRKDA